MVRVQGVASPLVDPLRIHAVTIRRYEAGRWSEAPDEIAIEEPFEIRIAGRSLAVIMRTPGHDRFLALGFLLGEGIIRSASDVLSCEPAPDRDGFPQANALDLRLRPELETLDQLSQRHFDVTSSCGLCGTASIDRVRVLAPVITTAVTVSASVLLSLSASLRAAQTVFNRTGGLHAAGLFDCRGRLLAHHEDVGRHNAVDKVIGQLLLEGRLPLVEALLMVSGRASFELIQKAAIAGIPVFAAVGAPSSLAVELAEASGITLVGMLRPDRFVVYTHPERVGRPGAPGADGACPDLFSP